MAKEIRIDGTQSDWYKEARFILKDQVEEKRIPRNIIDYAEQLVEKQMKLGSGTAKTSYEYSKQPSVATLPTTSKSVSKQTKNKWIDFFFWTSLTLLVGMSVLYFIL